MRKTNGRSWRSSLRERMKNPEFRENWEATAVGRAVALRLIAYRADNDLSQTRLAAMLGMKQPAVARLEAGESDPALATLIRISEALGIEFMVDVSPSSHRALVAADVGSAEVLERAPGARVLVATT